MSNSTLMIVFIQVRRPSWEASLYSAFQGNTVTHMALNTVSFFYFYFSLVYFHSTGPSLVTL